MTELERVCQGLAPLRSRASVILELECGAHCVWMTVHAGGHSRRFLADPVDPIPGAPDTEALTLVNELIVRIAVGAQQLAEQSRLARLTQLGVNDRVQPGVGRVCA